MNIKRAFLTAVASLMLPGYAMAQAATVSFDTVLILVPAGPYTQTVTATLTCNTGTPLQQSFEIGPEPTDNVVFNVDNFVPNDSTVCEITATSIDGFELLSSVANGVVTDGTCLYTTVPVEATSAELLSANTCTFTMAPAPFEYEITKVFDFGDDVDVSRNGFIEWACTNVLTGTESGSLTTYYGGFGIFTDNTWTIDSLIANPWAGVVGGVTSCTAFEVTFDSAIESDGGCLSPITFAPGDGLKGCTITNSVFFEGIPTLSQYGLAIMALLMLGVGFIGFRRFV